MCGLAFVGVAIPDAPAGDKPTLEFFRNPAPVAALTMRTLDGRTISSADWRGKVTIVNFWATWCDPCREEIPDLVALQRKYDKYVQIVGIAQDEAPPAVVQRFAAERPVNYPIVMLTPELETAFPGVYALPTSYLIDRDGRIVQKHVGMLTAARTERGAAVSDRSFLEWVLRKDFSDEVKAIVGDALAGRFPVRGEAEPR